MPTAPPRRRRRRAAAALAASALALSLWLAACGSSGSDGAATTTTADPTEIQGIVRPDPLQVGDQTLPQVDAAGTETPFALKADPGQLLFVAFGYTNCPDVCPTTLFDIKKARRDLGADGDRLQVAFATVDPERDTPEVMDQYLASFVDDGHPLRTTDPEALRTVQDAFGVTSEVAKEADGSTKVAHTARSFVVDDQGDVVVEWSFGTGPDVMTSDLRLLFDEQDAS